MSETGDFSLDASSSDVSVHVLQLPSAGVPGLSDLQVLDAVDNLVVQLDDRSRAVVVGPASALTDRPRTAEVDRARDGILRSDRLRAVIRLPKGLLVHSPRRALALWAIGPAHPKVAVRDRWTVVADVSDDELDGPVAEGIVTDVVAAMTPDARSAHGGEAGVTVGGDEGQVLGHQFRFARRVATAQLVLGRRSLVEGPTSRPRVDLHETHSVELAATVHHLLEDVDAPALADLRVEAVRATERPDDRSATVARALADGLVRAVPGNRLAAEDMGSDGLVVLGPAEVLGRAGRGDRRIALTTFATQYPSGRLTEPGDVVVCASPTVGAMVDTEGGKVVQTPARILRLTEAGRRRLLASLVAADVNSPLAQRIRDWRRWPLRLLNPDAAPTLASATSALAAERSHLIARLDTLERLATTLTDGVANGTLTISQKGR